MKLFKAETVDSREIFNYSYKYHDNGDENPTTDLLID